MNILQIIITMLLLAAVTGAAIWLAVNEKRRLAEWLLYAVTEAEKSLGAGTGQLKLRQVYDWFTDKFSVVSLIMSFDTFARLVDAALERMRSLLAENAAAAEYVKEKSNG